MATPTERMEVAQVLLNPMLSSPTPPNSGALALDLADALIERGWIDL